MTRRIIRITLGVISTICLWSAFLLMFDWQEIRQCRWLSLILLVCGLVCIFIAWYVARTPGGLKATADTNTDISDVEESKGEDFNSLFDVYKRQIETWMQTERPYLDPDFSLGEIIKRYKLNRTYASKIFNEGFGKSFILLVRDYRIAYAKELLRDNPGIAISEVAQQCGYSTVQAFHKAFAYCNDGLTPGKYAQSLKASSNKIAD